MNTVGSLNSSITLHDVASAGGDSPSAGKPDEAGMGKIIDAIVRKNPFTVRGADSTHDSATVSANIAEHLKNSPLFDKLNGLIASALVASGVRGIYKGLKEKDREKVLLGSKQTMWGAYHGLNSIETLFKTSFSLTPGLRGIGGFINADLGITALYRDFKNPGGPDADKVIFHAGATAWGFRHLALGAEGVAKSQWIASSFARSIPGMSLLAENASTMGAAGVVMGITGGALDALLGMRTLVKGIKTDDREKKILGALDMGIGVAMGASSALTGIAAAAVMGTASAGMVYRTWRTDKEEITHYFRVFKETVGEAGSRVKEKFREIFTSPR